VSVLVTLAVVIALLAAGVAVYNRLVAQRTQVQRAWRQFDAQLKNRHALVSRAATTLEPTLAGQEASAVIAACDRAARATGPRDAAAREATISEALTALWQRLSDHATELSPSDVVELRQALATADRNVDDAREAYNAAASRYNSAMSNVPGNLMRGVGNFPSAELFEKR